MHKFVKVVLRMACAVKVIISVDDPLWWGFLQAGRLDCFSHIGQNSIFRGTTSWVYSVIHIWLFLQEPVLEVWKPQNDYCLSYVHFVSQQLIELVLKNITILVKEQNMLMYEIL